MIVIQNTNSMRFSLNGIAYLKNYITAVHGNRVEIFNCYERCDVLVESTHYSQFSVSGTIYGSSAALQTALLPILYSRNTIGNSLLDQDNVDIRKYFTYSDTDTTTQVIQKINNLATYTIEGTQSVWFIGRTRLLFGGLSTIINPGNVILDPSPIFTTNSIVKYKLVNRGKGTYGVGGIQLTSNDIELVYQSKVNEDDVAEDPETAMVDFGNITGSLSAWLNTRNPAITLQPQDEGYTIFKGSISGASRSYLFIGEAGNYGIGQLQATENDFQILGGTTPAIYIPTLNDVLASGNSAKDKSLVLGKNAELLTMSASGLDYHFTGRQKSIRFAEPAPTDDLSIVYTIPAKKADDTFAMVSDLVDTMPPGVYRFKYKGWSDTGTPNSGLSGERGDFYEGSPQYGIYANTAVYLGNLHGGGTANTANFTILSYSEYELI
jgi:hypothetical protein